MKTVDIHTHMLSSEVAFDRLYDKVMLALFAKQLGVDRKELAADPYNGYIKTLISSVKNSEHIEKVVLFGVDACVNDAGEVTHKDKTVCATNEDVAAVYTANPDIIIPFFSINPKRPDALELIDKYTALGFRGAKFLQNYWGVDTREARYRPYFEKLAANNLPLIIHTGSEDGIHSHKSCEGIAMLEHPLDAGVTVVCSHLALSHEKSRFLKAVSKNPKNFNDEYFTLLEMLKTRKNLYADISALLTFTRAKVLRHLSEQHDIHDKLLFGTDFPVPFTTVFNSYDLPLKKRRELSGEKNPFDRYAKAILEYFPQGSSIYTNYEKVI